MCYIKRNFLFLVGIALHAINGIRFQVPLLQQAGSPIGSTCSVLPWRTSALRSRVSLTMEQHSIPSTSTPASWLDDREYSQRAALENFSSKEQNLLDNGTTFDSKYLYSSKLARR
jgi:hypothetical protein